MEDKKIKIDRCIRKSKYDKKQMNKLITAFNNYYRT